jgi:hypothetical protein
MFTPVTVQLELLDATSPVPRDGWFAINGKLTNNGADYVTCETQVVVTLPNGSSFALGPRVPHELWPQEVEVVYTETQVPGGIPTGTYTYTLEVYVDDVLVDSESVDFEVIDAAQGFSGNLPSRLLPMDLTRLPDFLCLN